MEVSRLALSNDYFSLWTAWGAKTKRLVVTSGSNRLYLLKLDPATGALSLDDDFRGTDGKTGFTFADREWPHGWRGTAMAHEAVFSR